MNNFKYNRHIKAEVTLTNMSGNSNTIWISADIITKTPVTTYEIQSALADATWRLTRTDCITLSEVEFCNSLAMLKPDWQIELKLKHQEFKVHATPTTVTSDPI